LGLWSKFNIYSISLLVIPSHIKLATWQTFPKVLFIEWSKWILHMWWTFKIISQNDSKVITYEVAHQDNPLQDDLIFFVPTHITIQWRYRKRWKAFTMKHFLLEQSWFSLDINCNALMKNLPLLPLDSFLKWRYKTQLLKYYTNNLCPCKVTKHFILYVNFFILVIYWPLVEILIFNKFNHSLYILWNPWTHEIKGCFFCMLWKK
jgi:hypothetical protein